MRPIVCSRAWRTCETLVVCCAFTVTPVVTESSNPDDLSVSVYVSGERPVIEKNPRASVVDEREFEGEMSVIDAPGSGAFVFPDVMVPETTPVVVSANAGAQVWSAIAATTTTLATKCVMDTRIRRIKREGLSTQIPQMSGSDGQLPES